MPIYEYSCEKCGSHLEVMQKMTDKPLTRCPECKGKLEKIFSQTSFQLSVPRLDADKTLRHRNVRQLDDRKV